MKAAANFFSSIGFVIFTGMLMATGSATASTPDGATPANEGVCDVLIGATPGLFGLCNAYCEAQDLDSFEKEPPRSKILANYNKKKQAGDPEMPCMQVPCPCWTDAEITSISADGFAMCTEGTNTIGILNTTPGAARQQAEADSTIGRERCRYIYIGEPRIIRSFNITAEEAQSCTAQVRQACNGL